MGAPVSTSSLLFNTDNYLGATDGLMSMDLSLNSEYCQKNLRNRRSSDGTLLLAGKQRLGGRARRASQGGFHPSNTSFDDLSPAVSLQKIKEMEGEYASVKQALLSDLEKEEEEERELREGAELEKTTRDQHNQKKHCVVFEVDARSTCSDKQHDLEVDIEKISDDLRRHSFVSSSSPTLTKTNNNTRAPPIDETFPGVISPDLPLGTRDFGPSSLVMKPDHADLDDGDIGLRSGEVYTIQELPGEQCSPVSGDGVSRRRRSSRDAVALANLQGQIRGGKVDGAVLLLGRVAHLLLRDVAGCMSVSPISLFFL